MSTPHAHDGPRSIGALLRGPANALNQQLLARLAERYPEMRQSFQAVFQHIDHPPHGTRLTELADRSLLSKQALIEVIDAMERCGWIERTADPDDRRAKLIRLTAAGMDVHDTAMAIGARIEEQWTRLLGAHEIKELRSLLERLNAALATSVHGEAGGIEGHENARANERAARG